MEACVCWVVALGAEAKPLVAAMGLKQSFSAGIPFPLYLSKDGGVRLVVSGVGKTNAAAATAAAGMTLPQASLSAWLNFGIAGSGSVPFGTPCLAAKIREESTDRSWYPGSVVGCEEIAERVEVLTVDRPRLDYPPGKSLVEMEAAGFYQTALRFSTVEFCHSLKLVSDGPGHPVGAIDKSLVGELCENGLRTFRPWVEQLSALLRMETEIEGPPQAWEDWTRRFRFSKTEEVQLRRLLQQWHALHPDEALLPEGLPEGTRDGKGALRGIRLLLWGRGLRQS
jgi:adenosylhomocysteine nucleosidase